MHVNRLNLGGKALFILEKKLQQKHQDEVWNLLYDSDEEFVPPLSSRNYTTQQVLSQGEMDKRGPIEYFKKMIEQEFILAIEKGKVIGFLTYIPDFLLQVEDRSVVCDYISTIVVSTNYRNHGVTRNMYHTLFENRRNKMFATRTWSENLAHLHLLETMGFELISRIKNDRGKGIDTVYYLKGVSKDV